MSACVFVYQGSHRAGGQKKGKVCGRAESDHCAYTYDTCVSMRQLCSGVHHPYHRPKSKPPLANDDATDY